MGISLTGLTPATTYDALIKTGDNTAIDGTPKVLSDGNGNNLPMEVSTAGVNLTGSPTVNSVAIANTTQLATKQDTLVSGTNIKTINGASLLGSGNIPVVTSPSGVAGAIQFSNGSAFASDAANFFWDNTNKRLGVGTNSPTALAHIVGNWQSPSLVRQWFKLTEASTGNTFGIVPSQVGLSNAGYTFQCDEANEIVGRIGQTLFGTGLTGGEMTARVGIRGNGSTSATTSLLVQNSAGTQLFRVDDNNRTYVGANIILLGSALSLSADVNNPQIYNTGGASLGINAPGSNGIIYGRSNSNTQEFFGFSALGSAIGSSTLTASAVLAVNSTTQGFLPPRMTTTQKNAIASPAAGLVVYDSTTNKLQCYNGSTWNDLF
jgi:hypothetical protein